MQLLAEYAQNAVAVLSDKSEDELYLDLGIQLDRQAAELMMAGLPDASQLLYGGASPGDDRPGFLRRLGRNFMRQMSSQFYGLLCNPNNDQHRYVTDLIGLGKAAAAVKLAALLTSVLSITGPVALIAGTILAGMLITSAHDGMCKTLAEMQPDKPA